MKSIEMDYTEFFVRFLKILHPNHEKDVETHSNSEKKYLPNENEICTETPDINSEMLVSACKTKNYAIIKELVSFGYR